MRTRTLITGGAGFIGSHLAARCAAAGDDVHVITRPTTSLQRLASLEGAITVHRADLSDEAAMARAVEACRPGRVFHLAASTRPHGAVADTAIAEVRNLMTLLAALGREGCQPRMLVRAGTIAEYGPVPAPYVEHGPTHPVTPYGRAMAACTDALQRLAPLLGFPVASARLALVYGPHQSESFLIPAMIRDCLRNRPFTVKRPLDRRDLIHVDDAVDALLLMAEKPLSMASTINIGTGVAPAMHDVARMIVEMTDADPAIVGVSGAQASGDISDLCCSTVLAQDLLGWTARIPLAEGLQRTVAWARAQNLQEA